MKRFADHWGCLLFALLGAVSCVQGQTQVVLAPIPIFQSFTQSGQPNAFGCVFSYATNSTSPIPTWTDSSGSTMNANPVVLSAGGAGNIWIGVGQLYTLVIKSTGGTNCSSGSTIVTVNGIGGGGTTQTVIVPYSATPTFTATSQNTLFTMTLIGNVTMLPLATVGLQSPAYITFQLTQDATGGRTFTWPSNVNGGAPIGLTANQVTTQEFVWNGTSATALGPAVTGNGPALSAGTIVVSGGVTGGDIGTNLTLGNLSTGTTLNTLTKLVPGQTAGMITATTDTGGIIGVCASGCGVTGPAVILQTGYTPCVYDATPTNGDYVQNSPTVAGNCHDAGATYPTYGQVIGRVGNATSAQPGVILFGPEIQTKGTVCSVVGSVNAATTSQQLITSCPFAFGALNVVGKAFLIKMSVSMQHASSENSSVYLAFGNTVPTALLSWVQASESASALSYHAVSEISCRVSVAGVAGSINCGTVGAVSNGTAATVAGTLNVITTFGSNDLTGNVFFGPMCSFSVASASNICSLDYFVIEPLN